MKYSAPATSPAELEDRKRNWLKSQARRGAIRKILWTVGITAVTVTLLEVSGNNVYHVLGALAFGIVVVSLALMIVGTGLQTAFGPIFKKGK